MSAGVVVAAVSAAVWRRDLKARPLLRIRYGCEFWGAHATRVLANASSHSRTLPPSFLQVSRNFGELGERGLEVFDDVQLRN